MRIVHVITRLIVGGAQENTLLSCQGQHDRGHDVVLLTGPALGPEGSLLEKAQSYGYRVEVIESMRRAILPGKDYRSYRTLVRRLGELAPDILHTHSSKAGIIGRWAAATAGARGVVHTIHGLAFTASTSPLVNRAYQFLERITAAKTTKIICVADAMRDQSLAAGIGRRDQYVTVYSGMETGPFLHPPVPRQTVRQTLGLADDHVAVGTIARLFDLKGHEDLLELASRLCAKWPNLRFLWIGDGSLRQSFERRMSQMGLRDRFILTGLVEPARVPELTGAMDILVHPSRREGLARALPQAALAGKPVITYDIDGAREALIDQATGLLIRPFDRAALADAIDRLMGDAPSRKQMGDAGRAFAMGRFDVKIMIDALDDVYRKCLATGGGGAEANNSGAEG